MTKQYDIPKTWEEADALNGGKTYKPNRVAPHTVLWCAQYQGRAQRIYYLSLHGTTIVQWKADTVQLWTGGYRTRLTRDRLNAVLRGSFSIRSKVPAGRKRPVWHVYSTKFWPGAPIKFEEGMVLDTRFGQEVNA